jgi:hypothetical protein
MNPQFLHKTFEYEAEVAPDDSGNIQEKCGRRYQH